jgi:hypothetical protein
MLLLGLDSTLTIFFLVVAISGVGVAYAAYYGPQSIRQGRLLKTAISVGQAQRHVGETVAVSGSPERLQGSEDPVKSNVLWMRILHQEWHSGGQNRSGGWRTVRTEEKGYNFLLRGAAGEQVTVICRPTEVYGLSRMVVGGGQTAGLFGTFLGSRSTRVVHETLRGWGTITACGRLRERGDDVQLVQDDTVGLLLTPKGPGAAAAIESLKGWGGLVVLPAAWVIVSGYIYFNYLQVFR